MLQHHLGAQKTRRQRHRGDVLSPQLPRHGKRLPDHRRLDHVEKEMSPVHVGIAVADFHDQPASRFAFRRLDQQRRREMAGDDVRVHRVAVHRKSPLQVGLPERFSEFVFRAFRNVVHQQMQPHLFLSDPRNELLDLRGLQMIHHYRDAFAAPRAHQFCRFFNRLRTVLVVIRRQSFSCFR